MTSISFIPIRERIWNASACWSSSQDQIDRLATSGIGAIVGKTCTLEPRRGNTGPTYDELCIDLRWNRMGLPNNGYEYYRNIAVHTMKKWRIPYVMSIYVQPNRDILNQLLEILRDYQTTLENQKIPDVLVELNVSCPNDTDRIPGFHLSDMNDILNTIQKNYRDFARIQFGLKLPPYFEKYKAKQMAELFTRYKSFVAYIVCSNTIPNGFHMVHQTTGGISGHCINRMISIGNIVLFRKVFEEAGVDIKIVGCGGIGRAEHVVEYMKNGADVVQLGSRFYNHATGEMRIEDIRHLIDECSINH